MPSSTSNFERVVPKSGSAKALLFAVLVAGLLLFGAEAFFRGRGFRPTVTDDHDLWAIVRSKARGANRNTLVAIGSSRTQMAVQPEAAEELRPDLVTLQLSIDGTHPVAVLFDLADDPSFRGAVLCEVGAYGLLRTTWGSQRAQVRHFHRDFSLDRKLDRLARTWLQERLVVLSHAASPRNLLGRLLRGERIQPAAVRMTGTRWRDVNYGDAPAEWVKRNRLARDRATIDTVPDPVTLKLYEASLDALRDPVSRIQDRGGIVCFWHPPVRGEYGDLYRKSFPRARFFDPIAERTGAKTLHSDDVPSLRDFDCPDGSHIKSAEAARFTKLLFSELEARGIVNPR